MNFPRWNALLFYDDTLFHSVFIFYCFYFFLFFFLFFLGFVVDFFVYIYPFMVHNGSSKSVRMSVCQDLKAICKHLLVSLCRLQSSRSLDSADLRVGLTLLWLVIKCFYTSILCIKVFYTMIDMWKRFLFSCIKNVILIFLSFVLFFFLFTFGMHSTGGLILWIHSISCPKIRHYMSCHAIPFTRLTFTAWSAQLGDFTGY